MNSRQQTSASFKDIQYQFAGHIRDPQNIAKPAHNEERRMKIYRDLFYNNIQSFIADGFPVLRAITADEKWHRLVREFMRDHRCQTPYFQEIAEEFLDFLQNTHQPQADDYPFMLELAHYEWVELALLVMDVESETIDYDPNGDLLEGRPLISPVAWNLSYQWPVHRIAPEYIPTEPEEEPVQLVVYRDRLDLIHFLEINVVTQQLLEIFKKATDKTGRQILQHFAKEIQHPEPDVLIRFGTALLEDLKERNIILGVTSP